MSKKPAVDAFAAARPIDYPFLVLAALFLAALIICNVVANKIVTVDLGFKVFVVSVGILPYPLTFLVTDLISEMYGHRRANSLVTAGFVASLFVLGVVWAGMQFPAIAESAIGDQLYASYFQSYERNIFGSMVAYLVAQYVDVWLFHFWRWLTNGRHLWLRNNGSTILSQLVDTTLVVTILFYGRLDDDVLLSMILDGWFFKVLCALADTPFCYLGVWILQRWRPRPI